MKRHWWPLDIPDPMRGWYFYMFPIKQWWAKYRSPYVWLGQKARER